MKQTLYIFISLCVIAFISFFMLFMQINSRRLAVYQTFIDKADQGEFDSFVGYQTFYYKHIKKVSGATYTIDYYYTVDNLKDIEVKLVIFVTPNVGVKKAENSKDKNDQTRAYIHNGSFVYDSKNIAVYGDFPISFGLNKNNFYYYNLKVKSLNNYEVVLYDYDGNIIHEETIDLTFEESDIYFKENFKRGLTSDELTALMMEDKNYLTPVYIVSGITIAISIALGVILFRKWHIKGKKS